MAVLRHVACFLVLSAFAVAQSSLQFYQTPGFPGAKALVAADFNLDGKMDLCTGEAILLGNGDGTFRSPISLNTSGPVVATGDFNNDGKPDLAITDPQISSNLQILFGNADGTFQPAVPINPGAALTQLIVRDVNGDGKPDIFGIGGSNLFVLLGNGDGSFRPALVYATGPNPDFMAVGDLNGDGKLDVVVLVTGLIAVLPGNGDGTFSAPINTVNGLYVLGMAIGDVNSDGKLDLLLSDFLSYQTFVLLGNGDGTFQPPARPVSGVGTVALADLNNDGKPELILESRYGQGPDTVSIYQGLGDGTFTHLRDYALKFNGFDTAVTIVVADFNSDGKIDLAMDSSILLGQGDAEFSAAPALATPGGDVFTGTTGDFNNDGKVDVVVAAGLTLDVLIGDGTGFFSQAQTYPPINYPFVASDLNGDGNLDIVSATTTAHDVTITAFLGNGDGSFGAPVNSLSTINGDPSRAVVADFNGDHKPDVAVAQYPGDRTADGSVLVFLGNGDGTFSAPVGYFAGAFPFRAMAEDFNNDSKMDLVVSSSAGIAILLGNGNGTFQPATFLTVPPESNVFSVADVNGDGKLDLIGSNGVQVQVFLGNGDGTFQALAPMSSPSFVTLVDVADLNGDGIPDLVWVNGLPDLPQVNVSLGNGDGTFASSIVAAAPRVGIALITLADFNNDKKTDLLFGLGGLHWEPVGGLFTFLNVTPPDFAIAANPTSITISAAGQSATSTITTRGSAGFAGLVNLSCSVSPSNGSTPPTCSLNPTSISINNAQNSGTATLTIFTTARSTAALHQHRQTLELLASMSTGIFGCFFLIGTRLRKQRYFLFLLVLAFVLLSSSCGGGGGGGGAEGSSGTTAGTYTVTLTATSGPGVHLSTVTVTVP